MTQLWKGQFVRIRASGTTFEWCLAEVAVASTNGKSVGLLLDGAVRVHGGGIFVGFLPLSIDYETERMTGLDGVEYEMELNGA